MSEYQDFVRDFPGRCRDVLEAFSAQAERSDREVTLLLMATAAGFVMPLERLGEGDAIIQPSLDRSRFAVAMTRLKAELEKEVGQSDLLGGASWRGGPLRSADGTPDDWPECRSSQALVADTKVFEVVRQLRNGLAHGNVFSRPARDRQIAELVFVSGGRYRKTGREIPLKYLIVSPGELRQFLNRWFKFVADLHLPQRLVQEAIDDAA